MLIGYPFWADTIAPTTATIYDPLLKTTITTLTYRGNSRVQKLMGISVSSGTRTLANSCRVLVGNSMPTYRRITVPTGGHQNDLGAEPQILDTNYFDLGGLEVLEGETISITGQGLEGAAGTGTLAGVLWVEDLEPGPVKIPQGNIICLVNGSIAAAADCGATLTDVSAALDARTLENNRLYTPFMSILEPEDDDVEAVIYTVGKNACAVPVGRFVFPSAPFQFTGLEYNSGHIALHGQTAAAAGFINYLYLIESDIPGGAKPTNAPAVQPVVSPAVPGAISVGQVISQSATGMGSFRRMMR